MFCFFLALASFILAGVFAYLKSDPAWATGCICGCIFTTAYVLLNKVNELKVLRIEKSLPIIGDKDTHVIRGDILNRPPEPQPRIIREGIWFDLFKPCSHQRYKESPTIGKGPSLPPQEPTFRVNGRYLLDDSKTCFNIILTCWGCPFQSGSNIAMHCDKMKRGIELPFGYNIDPACPLPEFLQRINPIPHPDPELR